MKIKNNFSINKSGFTLIELLVSIAIILLLATVVIYTISDAKDKNADAAIKQGLSTISSQAGIFYLDHKSFVGFCSSLVSGSAYQIVLDAALTYGLSTLTVNNVPLGGSNLNSATCNNSTTEWAAEVPMRKKDIGGSGKSSMFCVDSTGFAGPTSASIGMTTVCP